MSCSCCICELGQTFTSLFLGVGPINSLFSLFFFFFFFSFFFFFPWSDWLVGCFFFLFFFGLSRCEFYFFWHEFYFLINLGCCLFFFFLGVKLGIIFNKSIWVNLYKLIFFHPSIFSPPIKHKLGKLKSLLSSYFLSIPHFLSSHFSTLLIKQTLSIDIFHAKFFVFPCYNL